jgi:hypothetical protein
MLMGSVLLSLHLVETAAQVIRRVKSATRHTFRRGTNTNPSPGVFARHTGRRCRPGPSILRSPRLFLSSQCPHVHLLCLRHLALVGVEVAEDFDRFHLSSQRPYIHLLRLRHLALVGVERAEIVECRRVFYSPRSYLPA